MDRRAFGFTLLGGSLARFVTRLFSGSDKPAKAAEVGDVHGGDGNWIHTDERDGYHTHRWQPANTFAHSHAVGPPGPHNHGAHLA
jgi:hypothetical protein